MIAKLRSYWLDVNASYWFYPALFSVVAFFLSFATIWLDRNGAAEWLAHFSWIQPSRPEGARNFLTVISGSMIGVASTVFSITIAAVAYASGNYGPRLLTNFMEDKGNQLSLGVFIATFVYAVMILRVVRSEDESSMSIADATATSVPGFTPQLSLLVATAMAIWAVAVLVYFLHHIPASIRINTVLEGIGRRFVRKVKKRFPDDHGEREPRQQKAGQPITAAVDGYITIINFDRLDDIAEDNDACIALSVRTGDFVNTDLPIAEVSGAVISDELVEQIRDSFSIGGMRTATQDVEYLIDELVEIALRALSPGINDPFTAITALHWLGAGTAELAGRDLDRGPEQDDYDRNRVEPLSDGFEHFLQRGFGAVRASAATSPMTAKNFLHMLLSVAQACPSEHRRRALLAEGMRLFEQVKLEIEGPSLAEIESGFDAFSASMTKLDR